MTYHPTDHGNGRELDESDADTDGVSSSDAAATGSNYHSSAYCGLYFHPEFIQRMLDIGIGPPMFTVHISPSLRYCTTNVCT